MSVWVDFHNHVIPAVDDGARDGTEARGAVEALRAQGVARVVATPHLSGALTTDPRALEARLREIDEGWARLRAAVPEEAGVTLGRGAEVRLDAPEVDLSDPRLRVDGSRSVLVEFAHFTVPPRSAQALAAIVDAGYQPVVAHPERYRGIDAGLAVVRAWVEAGACLQVNAGSLLGRYGDRAAGIAERLLAGGWAHCMASDYHARGEPESGPVRAMIEGWGAVEEARILFEENPSRIVAGETCLQGPLVARPRSLAERLRRWVPWT
jgi:protein-tyrosine phosphatase